MKKKPVKPTKKQVKSVKTKSIQQQIEERMVSEIKESGYSQIRIDEYDRNGKLSSSKKYIRLLPAVRKMIDFAKGEFPIYQGSQVTSMGYKMRIQMN